MKGLDKLDFLFVGWAFFYQIVLIVHFAVRKRFFESYTKKFGWIVYALGIPATLISLTLLLGGKVWTYWLGGFLCLVFSTYGYIIDFVKQTAFRKPLVMRVVIPYVTLYLSTLMFYWWPLRPISRPLWIAFTVLYVISMILNIRSH